MPISKYLLAMIFFAILLSGCATHIQTNRDVLYQTSTINALLEGVYDGDQNFGKLRQYGDFGIGTFDAIDGEMIAFGGNFYQIKADGTAHTVDDSMKAPFAVVTFFDIDKSIPIENAENYKRLGQILDDNLPTKNIFYAIRIDGIFKYIKTRSVPKQNKPYPKLVDVVKKQPNFEFHNIEGTIDGFWCPSYVEGINVKGYHFHFLTKDKKSGGHLLECQMEKVKAEIDYTSEFYLALPDNDDFYRVDLSIDKEKELNKVEK